MSWPMAKRNAPRQMDLSDYCPELPLPDMGGTTGGERERRSKSGNLSAVWTYDPLKWPDIGPDEPEVFWLHWQAVGDRYPDTEFPDAVP